MIATKRPRYIGEEVRYYTTTAGGWRFGQVIDVRVIDGLQFATVAFRSYREWPGFTAELVGFLLERCGG